MNLKTHQTATAFLQIAQPYLAQDEATNNLMFGLTLDLRNDPLRFGSPPYFATVEDERGLVVAGLMTPPFNLQIFSPVSSPTEGLRAILDDLQANRWPLPGVLARTNLAREMAGLWAARTGGTVETQMNQRVYALEKVSPLPAIDGDLRPAGETDIDLVTAWTINFGRDALGEDEVDRAKVREQTTHRIETGNIFLWELDRAPVSMAAKSRPTLHGACVNLVYTPPDLRRRGYATACVAALSQHLLDSGYQFCCLFTDLANPTSNAIYQQIGYRPVGDVDVYRFVEGEN